MIISLKRLWCIRGLLGLIAFFLSLSGCAPYQYVPNAYATPNKRVEGAVVGAMAGGMAGATSQLATAGTLIGGSAGVGYEHSYGRYSLMTRLKEHGINVIARGDTLRIVLPSDDLFEPGTPTIKSSSYPTVDYVAALLKEYGKAPVMITGYTDNIGALHRNKTLSLQQAQSVLTYLWVHGIEFDHLYAEGKGPQSPVASNKTVLGSAANRRIEILLTASCKQADYKNCVERLQSYAKS